MSAYLIGRDDDYLCILERAHQAHINSGERRRAVRCAFWLGFQLWLRGEVGRATGWFARGQRLLEGEDQECAEQGYLLIPVVEQQVASGDLEAAYAGAARAADIGERCRDADLIACARMQQGRVRVEQGRVAEGLALLDEVMIAVVAGELSLLVTGLMYCSVIQACQAVYALGRAREWTTAMTRWCEPDMAAFTGVCRVHRTEILQLHGDWQGAIEEARRARERGEGMSKGVPFEIPSARSRARRASSIAPASRHATASLTAMYPADPVKAAMSGSRRRVIAVVHSRARPSAYTAWQAWMTLQYIRPVTSKRQAPRDHRDHDLVQQRQPLRDPGSSTRTPGPACMRAQAISAASRRRSPMVRGARRGCVGSLQVTGGDRCSTTRDEQVALLGALLVLALQQPLAAGEPAGRAAHLSARPQLKAGPERAADGAAALHGDSIWA